ncbi:MAG: DUF6270 domain-containing protein, partial [Clostridium sp.]
PYVTGDNKLSVFCRKTIDNIKCITVTEFETNKVKLNLEDIKLSIKNIIFKKRILKEIETYIEEISIPYNKGIINIQDIFNNKVVNESYYDVFAEMYNGYEIPITYSNPLIQCENIRCFSNSNKLMLKVQLKDKNYTTGIEVTNNEIIINLENELKEELIEVRLINRDRKYTIMKGFKVEYILEENRKSLKLNKNEIYNLSHKKRNRYEVQLVQKKEEVIYESLIGARDIGEGITDMENIISLEKVENNMLLSIRKIKKTISISILGSCLTRSAFSTNEYFNPTYKRKYNISYTHFQSSLISVMNEETIKFDLDKFTNSNEFMKECITTEFNKDFFIKFQESNCDYLIIDLFGDAMRGVIQFPNGSIVAGTIDYETEEVLFNLPEGTKIIKSTNIKEFLPLWQEGAKRFAKKIKEYINEEKILINYPKISEKYLDENREEKAFKGQEEYIRTSNALLDYTTNYLSQLLPKAKVIDSGEMNYIANKPHPLGLSSTHFINEYYKDLMALIDMEIISK